MSLETIYLVGQTVAAFAIVLSLAYAGLQVRQNTRLKRAELTNEIGIHLHKFNLELGRTPQIAALWRKGLLEGDALTGADKTQFTLLMSAAFLGFENVHLTYRAALLNPQLQDRAYRQMVFMFQSPGTRSWWRANKFNLTTDFIAYVERDVLPTSDLLAESQGLESQTETPKAPGLTPSND